MPPNAPALKLRTPEVRWTSTMPRATSAVSEPVAAPRSTNRSAASLKNAVASIVTEGARESGSARAWTPLVGQQSAWTDSRRTIPSASGIRSTRCPSAPGSGLRHRFCAVDAAVDVFHQGLDFGEGPRWHDGRLWVSDFFAQRVSSFDAGGTARVEVELDDQPSGLGWLPSGDLLVVAMRSRQVRRVDAAGTMHLHADLSDVATGMCNDMVVDRAGNAYVGNFGFDTEAPSPSRADAVLALVRPDGTVEAAADGMKFPNGSL